MAAAAVCACLSAGVLYGTELYAVRRHGIFPRYTVYMERAYDGAHVCDAGILSGDNSFGGNEGGACMESDVPFHYVYQNRRFGRHFTAAAAVSDLRAVFRDVFYNRHAGVSQTAGQIYFLFIGFGRIMGRMMLEAENISVRFNLANDRITTLKEFAVALAKRRLKFREFWALRDVSFEVRKGEVLGIIGNNGAGKSTLLKVISGIMKPTQGRVELYGNVVPMLELGSGFDFELSGRENVFLNGAILGYREEFLRRKYDEIAAFSQLGDFLEVPLRNYSSGMVMRLAFSIATVVCPEVLIVDEILAVGDADFQEKSRKRMMELMSGGTTVLFVSHNMMQIREMCSRVLWLEQGRTVDFGKTKEICDRYERKTG